MNINVSIASVSIAVLGGGGVLGMVANTRAALSVGVLADEGAGLRRGVCCR